MGAGIFSGLEGQFLASRLPNANYYKPSGTQAADADWMRAMQAIAAATDRNTGMIDPTLLQSYSRLMGIDLSGLVQAGAIAGGQYGQAATMAGDLSAGARGRGDTIWNAAPAPPSEIHDFQRPQTIDPSRAADSPPRHAVGGGGAG